jgi:hypothetical protein
MSTQTQSYYPGDWLKYEAPNLFSREEITILAGSGATRPLTSGMVLAKVTKGAATGAAVAGNTGNGTITAAPTVGAAAKVGVYRLVCIEPATNVGKFTVEDPDGINIGVATVAVEFTTHLTFTIADGATDFVSGDAFTITVAAGSEKWVQYSDTGGATGLATPAGLLLLDVTAADGTDATGTAIVRDAVVSDNGITWPSSADAGEKAAAVVILKTLGIIVREGA